MFDSPIRLRSRVIGFLLLLLSCCLIGCVMAPIVQATSPLQSASVNPLTSTQPAINEPTPLCRFGINVSSFPDNPFYIADFDIAPLRVGWYVDYRAAPSDRANNGAQYAMVMGVSDHEDGSYAHSPTGADLDATIAAFPDGVYIIGNEPDRRILQGDMLPENYAYAYHDAYMEIKSKDPEAQVWAGAIIQPTPVRLQYLDRVLAAYQARYSTPMPVDGWAIHSFLLNERSCRAYNNDLNICWGADIPPGIDASDGQILTPDDNARLDLFQAGIVRFRTWMADNGYRNSPLYVSEYGVLMPEIFGFPVGIVNNYMSRTFDYMLETRDELLGYPADDNRLVQRFSWFSTFDPDYNGYLYQSKDPEHPMTPPFQLSEIGHHYQEYVANEEETSDLALLSLRVLESPRRIEATIGNSGNRLATTQATLRVFEGDSLEGAEQIGQAVPVKLAGCGTIQTVTVAWAGEDETPTNYRIWAQISGQDFADGNPENDVLVQETLVNGLSLFLPILADSSR